jgi:hypothetical protein
MYIILGGNIVSGMSFTGPFKTHEDAVFYCKGSDSPSDIVKLTAPNKAATKLERNEFSCGDDIWGVHKQTEELIVDVGSGDTMQVLRLALEALAVAGTMEDRKIMAERDSREKQREANESFMRWCQDNGQFP